MTCDINLLLVFDTYIPNLNQGQGLSLSDQSREQGR